MPITNAKSTWLARLLGKTNERNNIPEEAAMQTNPNAGINPGLRFQNQSPLFGPEGLGSAPQKQVQPQSQPRTRYNLFEMTQPKPTRDTESEDIIKRRAKINALGAGISGLAGLASMATGGDVAEPVDLITPWNMDQSRMLDMDYRNRLQNWIDQGFQVDQANTQILNREIDQNIDAENRMEQIRLRGEEARATAAQRAFDELNKIAAQGEQKLIEAMQGIGVDPYSKTAYQDYLQKRAKQFETESNYTKARTNWNNRVSSGAGRSSGKTTFTAEQLATYKKNRDRLIAAEQAKLQGLDPIQDAEQIKAINERIKQLNSVNPGTNELTDMEMLQEQEQEEAVQNQQSAQGFGFPYTPGQGFSFPAQTTATQPAQNQASADQGQSDAEIQAIRKKAFDGFNSRMQSVPQEQRGEIMSQMGSRVVSAIPEIESGNQDVVFEIVEEWMQNNFFEDEEEAYQMLLLLIEKYKEQ